VTVSGDARAETAGGSRRKTAPHAWTLPAENRFPLHAFWIPYGLLSEKKHMKWPHKGAFPAT
jgi:hypothetical protein